jgi:hypothetical protein
MKLLIAVSNGERKRNIPDFAIDITGLEKDEIEEKLLEIVNDIYDKAEEGQNGTDHD